MDRQHQLRIVDTFITSNSGINKQMALVVVGATGDGTFGLVQVLWSILRMSSRTGVTALLLLGPQVFVRAGTVRFSSGTQFFTHRIC